MESIKQKRIAKVIHQELANIFQRQGLSVYKNSVITISAVKLTPDLLVARVYLSIYNSKDEKGILEMFSQQAKTFRGIMGKNIRNQIRRIPELEFFLEESLDEVFRLEKIFNEIKKTDTEKSKG